MASRRLSFVALPLYSCTQASIRGKAPPRKPSSLDSTHGAGIMDGKEREGDRKAQARSIYFSLIHKIEEKNTPHLPYFSVVESPLLP